MKTSLFVAIPSYGGLNPLFTQALMRFVHDPGMSIAVKFNCGDSLVSRSRNVLTAQFLASDCTHMLFIDSDLIFSAEHVQRLLAHQVDVVGGFYPKKQDGDLAWVCNALPDLPAPDPITGLISLRYIGTGFLLVARGVFEHMAQECDIAYTPDGRGGVEWDFWPVGVHRFPDGSRRYLSEDWFFCQRWLDLGGKVCGDTRVVLKHCGHAIYPLQSQQSALLPTP